MNILVINPFGSDKYDELMRQELARITSAGTTLVVTHLNKGIEYLDYRYYELYAAIEAVERIVDAEKEGYDGVYMACGYEPGVLAARELVDIPVIGSTIPPICLAYQLGQNYSIIYPNKVCSSHLWDLIRNYGLEQRCVSIKSVDIPHIDNQIVETRLVHNPPQLFERVVELSLEAKREGAEVIINSCTIIAARLNGYHEKFPEELKSLTFLNGNYSALMYLEMLVNLHQKMGVKVSREAYYLSPKAIHPTDFKRFRKSVGRA